MMALTPLFSFVQKYILLLVVFPLVSLIAGWLIYYRPPLQFLESTDLQCRKIIENPQHLNTVDSDPKLQLVKYDTNGLTYSYRIFDALQQDAEVILLRKDEELMDFSKYNQLSLKVRSRGAKRVPVELMLLEKNRKDKNGQPLYRQQMAMVDVTEDFQTINIPLKDFITPRWWYSNQDLTEEEIGSPDFSQVQWVGFGNDKLFFKNNNQSKQVLTEITSIEFSRNLLPIYYYTIAHALFLLLMLGIYGWAKNGKFIVSEVIISYDHIELQNREAIEWKQLLMYLTENFFNPDLSLATTQTATGLHERRISALIKKETGLSFKQYLNGFRIREAKVLLEGGQLPVSEIAFKVGYGNVTHFNKVFKATEGCAPTDYRKEGTAIT